MEQERYADRIAKLLRKAESTTDAEAEALIAKAQELMTRYAIDEAMLAAAQGIQLQDKLVTKNYHFTGIYQRTLMEIGTVVARVNETYPVYRKESPRTTFDKNTGEFSKRPAAHVLMISGFERDVDRVLVLITSLELQAIEGMGRWWKTVDAKYYSNMEKYKERRQFLSSFTFEIGKRLKTAAAQAKTDVVHEHATASGVSDEKAGESVSLVLVNKRDRVSEYVDSQYGYLRTSHSRVDRGSSNASEAGRAAGSRANIGQPGVGGAKKGIGR